jgi:hypothetical protein
MLQAQQVTKRSTTRFRRDGARGRKLGRDHRRLAAALGVLTGGWAVASIQTVVWVVVAALLFHAERHAKHR